MEKGKTIKLKEQKKADGLIFNLKLRHSSGGRIYVKVPGYMGTFTSYAMRKENEEFSMLVHKDSHLTMVFICKERDAFVEGKEGTIIYKVIDGRNGPGDYYPNEIVLALRNDASRIFPVLHVLEILKSFGEVARSARGFLPDLLKGSFTENDLKSFKYLKLSYCPKRYLEVRSFVY